MDKEEYRIKLNQMNHYVDQKKYKEAMDVVDSIDWRRVKNVHTLCVVGEIYAANRRYEESREIFLLAYHRAPIGKNILYRLIEVSLKMKDIQEAEEFFEEFQEVAPNDSNQYILRYKISKAENASLEEQIRILEDYKEKEFTERWSYELAKLYYQNGETKKCLELCNDIILWFNEGRYVLKAMDLKNRMGQLTGAEKEKYEQQFVPNLTKVGEMEQNAEVQSVQEDVADEEAPVIESVRIDERDVNNAESLQEKISKSIRDIFNGSKKESEEEFAEEDQDIQEEEHQDEMIKDKSSEAEEQNVPELEPEDVSADTDVSDSEPAEEEEIAEELPEEKSEEIPDVSRLENEEELSDSIKELKKFEIPDSMKDVDLAENVYADIPKAPDIILPDMDTDDEKAELNEFNLEDMILSAATAQGIEIPKDTVSEQPKIQDDDVLDEDYMTEEDLQSAEDEFLNGPAGRKPEPEFEEEEIRGEDSYEDDELNDDDFYEYSDDEDDDFYGDEAEDNEDSFYEDDELYEDDEEEFYEDEDDELDEEEEFEELPVVSRKPLTEKKDAKIKRPDPNRKTVFREEEELERFVDSIRPQEAMDIIPREKQLTDSEKKLFTYFAKVPGLREQLVETLCDVQDAASDKTSRTGNIIVMGGRETGKTRLISGLIPAICKELNLEAAKVAYVFADQINGKNIAAIVKKMAGGFLVIENANQLKKETVNQLSKAMEFRTDGMIVIMEDEKIGMRKLMARFPKFASKFTSMINIPVFTNDELVNFAMIYTRERGYAIDQKAMVALYNLISTNQKDDEPMNVGAVKDIIDNAIARSTGGIRKLSRNISKKRTDVDGYVVLYEKDFN
ncbi:MAG: hypothetical protein ACLTWG_14100 [Blautia sp.]|uniref:hypothetical protein n=1 Tax=Blautia sp. TaxID=1955243 RepID=UPI003996BD6D